MVRFNLNNKGLLIFLLIAGVFLFGGQLFNILGTDIRLVTTSATCTGTIQGTPLSDADCKGFGPIAYGSSVGGWAFSTSGEGTITLPEASKQFAVNGLFRNVGGSTDLKIFNYAAGVYEPSGFVFGGPTQQEDQTRSYGSNYLDSSKTIIKFKWNMACSGQCAAGVERLKVNQYDTLSTATTTSTTTSTTSTIGNATSTQGVLTTSTSTTSLSSTTTVVNQYIAGTSTTSVPAITSTGFNLGANNTTLLIVVITAIAGFIYYQRRNQ